MAINPAETNPVNPVPDEEHEPGQSETQREAYDARIAEVIEIQHEINDYKRRLERLRHEQVPDMLQDLELIHKGLIVLREGKSDASIDLLIDRYRELVAEIENIERAERIEEGIDAAKFLNEEVRITTGGTEEAKKERKWINDAIDYAVNPHNIGEDGMHEVDDGHGHRWKEGIPVDRLMRWAREHRLNIPEGEARDNFDAKTEALIQYSVSWKQQQYGADLTWDNMNGEQREDFNRRRLLERRHIDDPRDFRYHHTPGVRGNIARREMENRRVLNFEHAHQEGVAAELENNKRQNLNLEIVYAKLKDAGVPEGEITEHPEFKQAVLAESRQVETKLAPEIAELVVALREQRSADDIEPLLQLICNKTGLDLSECKQVFEVKVNDIHEDAAKKARVADKFQNVLRTVSSLSGLGLVGGIVAGVATGGIGTMVLGGVAAVGKATEAIYGYFREKKEKKEQVEASLRDLESVGSTIYESVVKDLAALVAHKKQQQIFEMRDQREGAPGRVTLENVDAARDEYVRQAKIHEKDPSFNRNSEGSFSGAGGFEAVTTEYRHNVTDEQLQLLRLRFPEKTTEELMDYAICAGVLAERDQYNLLNAQEHEMRHESQSNILRKYKGWKHLAESKKRSSWFGKFTTAVAIPAARILVPAGGVILDRVAGAWMGANLGDLGMRTIQKAAGKGDLNEVTTMDIRVLEADRTPESRKKREEYIARARRQLHDKEWCDKNPLEAAKLWEYVDKNVDQEMPERASAIAGLAALDAGLAATLPTAAARYDAMLHIQTKRGAEREAEIKEKWDQAREKWGAARAAAMLAGGAAGAIFGPDLFQYLRDKMEANRLEHLTDGIELEDITPPPHVQAPDGNGGHFIGPDQDGHFIGPDQDGHFIGPDQDGHFIGPDSPDATPGVSHYEYSGKPIVWNEVEHQLGARPEFNQFDSLHEGEQTYAIDRIENMLINNQAKYGVPDGANIDHMTPAQMQAVKWDQLFADAKMAGMDKLFPHLSADQIAQIEHNNDLLNQWVKLHPDQHLTHDNVNQAIAEMRALEHTPTAAGTGTSTTGSHDAVPGSGNTASMDANHIPPRADMGTSKFDIRGGHIEAPNELSIPHETLQDKLNFSADSMTADDKAILQAINNYEGRTELVGVAAEGAKSQAGEYLYHQWQDHPEYMHEYADFRHAVHTMLMDRIDAELGEGTLGIGGPDSADLESNTLDLLHSMGVPQGESELFVDYIQQNEHSFDQDVLKPFLDHNRFDPDKFNGGLKEFLGMLHENHDLPESSQWVPRELTAGDNSQIALVRNIPGDNNYEYKLLDGKIQSIRGDELHTLMNPPEHTVEAKIPVRVESGAADDHHPYEMGKKPVAPAGDLGKDIKAPDLNHGNAAADGYFPENVHVFSPEQRLDYLQQHAAEADAYFDKVISRYESNPQELVNRAIANGHQVTTQQMTQILSTVKSGSVVDQMGTLTGNENLLHFVHDVMQGEKPDTDAGNVLKDYFDHAFNSHMATAHNKAA